MNAIFILFIILGFILVCFIGMGIYDYFTIFKKTSNKDDKTNQKEAKE